MLARRYLRIPPKLNSPQEIAALMNAAGALRPTLRVAIWQTLIGYSGPCCPSAYGVRRSCSFMAPANCVASYKK